MRPDEIIKSENILVDVLLPIHHGGPYTYALDLRLIEAGDYFNLISSINGYNDLVGVYVVVPFRNRQLYGVIVGLVDEKIKLDRIRNIEKLCDCSPMDQLHLKFIMWLSKYTLHSAGLFLKISFSSGFPNIKRETVDEYNLIEKNVNFKLTAHRARVIQELKKNSKLTLSEICQRANVSSGVIKGLYELDLVKITTKKILPDVLKPSNKLAENHILLSSEQLAAYKTLRQLTVKQIGKLQLKPVLLYGVTGSGKTALIAKIAQEMLNKQYQVLIMIPEIGLLKHLIEQFTKLLGFCPDAWHSQLSMKQRCITWQRIVTGVSQVIIGVRSSVLLPFFNLGCIIVDEEHDGSYKQQDSPVYNARDAAILRANINKIPVVLSSGTPSIESYYNAMVNKYHLIELKSRYGGASLPSIEVIDLIDNKLKRGSWISAKLEEGITYTLAQGKQCLLYLNRRGYCPVVKCSSCGETVVCKNCDAELIKHKSSNMLVCHLCDYKIKFSKICMSCSATGKMYDYGVGVERLAEEVSAKWPNAKVATFSSDSKGLEDASLNDLVQQAVEGRLDIIIGTQLITKGFHIPGISLVSVILGDIGLNSLELKGTEKLYQTVVQVAGRSGRGIYAGKAFVQTNYCNHPVMKAITSNDFNAFYEYELEKRRLASLPPFCRIVGIIVSGTDARQTEEYSRFMRNNFIKTEGIEFFGPTEALIARINKRYRVRILVKSAARFALQKAIKLMMDRIPAPRGDIRIKIDVDPIEFY